MTVDSLPVLAIAPARVMRGAGILTQSPQGNRARNQASEAIAALGQRPLVVGGNRTLKVAAPFLTPVLEGLSIEWTSYKTDCSEAALTALKMAAGGHKADVIVGVGGGKALDTAKLLAHQLRLPVVTIPSSAATCAAWTALSNVYSDQGAFLYDLALDRCPDLLILDYDLVLTAPQRTLIAGVGDALAKWYEASVSSGISDKTLVIAAVQQARVLRDILFQKTAAALQDPGGAAWREVVDAVVLMAGVIGGLGGAQCRTVAAHAVHNGLTHLDPSHGTLHGEKVAYGILAQLRLEELGGKNALAITARRQLVQFYSQMGLPKTLDDLGMGQISLAQLRQAAEFACREESDIHHLPFVVSPDVLMAAMVSTVASEMRPVAQPLPYPETLAKSPEVTP